MNDNVPMAASYPNHPVLTGEELIGQSNQVARRIESCGASVELTNAVSAASDLGFHIRRFVDGAKLIENDRDSKAANLQLLVEKVLMWQTQDSAFQVAPEVMEQFNETVELARSLKQ